MLPNNLYNLMMQLVEESKSLQRIQNEYMRDAGEEESARNFWQKMVTDKDAHIAELRQLIKTHI